MNRPFLLALAFLFLSLKTAAQPWEIFLGGTGRDILAQIVPGPDGNFYATGAKQSGGATQVWLLKINPASEVIWEKTFSPVITGTHAFGNGLTVLADGTLIITGEQRTGGFFDSGTALALRTDADGNEIWKRSYVNVAALYDAAPSGNGFLLVGWEDYTGSTDAGLVMLVNASGQLQWKLPVEVADHTKVRRIFPTADGNFLLVGRSGVIGVGYGGVFLRKIQPDGTQIWQKTAATGFTEETYFPALNDFYNQPLGAVQQPDGSVWMVNPSGDGPDFTLLHFSPDGELLQQKDYGSPSLGEFAYGLTALADGGWLITGQAAETTNSPAQGFAAQVDGNGLEQWRHYYGAGGMSRLFGGAALPDGHFLLAGMSNFDGWLLNVEADGNALPWKIEGRIVVDLNNNCQADPGEPPASGWFVSATAGSLTRLLATDADGKFTLPTGEVATTLTALAPDTAWSFCAATQIANTDADNPLAQLTFLVQAADGGCPRTQISVTQPDLRRCERSRLFVSVQNRGVGESGDLFVTLRLDPALSVVSVSEPYQQYGSSLLEIEIPPMSGLQQKTIAVEVTLACDVQLGATHAVEARLQPAECAVPWNGAWFAVEGHCLDENVLFLLKNKGASPTPDTRYRVLADDLVHTDWTEISLPDSLPVQTLTFPADGRTWRVELEQTTGFPNDSRPGLSIEGCGKGENGLHSTGFRSAWPYDGGWPQTAGMLAPNTTGVPNRVAEAMHGFGLYNFVGDSNWLEYTARLRNPLHLPAEQVEFHFTFSSNFDASTFQALASNAPVQLTLDNTGVLRAAMSNLQLDTGGYALLRFRIRPRSGVPADAGPPSLFTVYADAYVNGSGPIVLAPGFHNFAKDYPVAIDGYNIYPPEVHRFGGRKYDFGTAMAQAADGSVFLAGESNSYSEGTNDDGLVIKTDAVGRAYWLTAIDLGDQASNTFRGVAPLPDGGCLAVGNYAPPATVNFYLSDYYVSLVRLDADGKLLWEKKLRPAGSTFGAWANGIVETADGGIVVFGYSLNETGKDHFYLKINADGAVEWQQFQDNPDSAFEPVEAIRTADGDFVFIGKNPGIGTNKTIYLEKINANGQLVWTHGYPSQHGISLGGLALMADGGFLVSGSSGWAASPGNYVNTPTFIRFSPLGTAEWEKNPILGPFNNANSYSLVSAPAGGFFSAGEVFIDTVDHFDDMMLLKLDENADPVWWNHYGAENTEWANAILLTASDQILLWGHNQARPPLWDLQGVLVHTDWHGNLFVDTKPEPAAPIARTTVFPNPAQGLARVQVTPDPAKPLYWFLNDLTGLKVRQGQSSEATFDLDVSSLPAGLYFLAFPGTDLASKRIVVLW